MKRGKVPQAAILQLCAEIGVHPDDVNRIIVDPRHVIVRTLDRDADGHHFVRDGDVAFTDTVYEVER